MINIPTEMLRTFVAVVDNRSYTKAAISLGVTQPAVSAQIKRLQIILGVDLFDKHAPGVALSPAGETAVTYARRLLSVNDQIVKIASPDSMEVPIKIGVTGDYFSADLPEALIKFRKISWRRFDVVQAPSQKLLHQLRSGEIDLAVSFTPEKPEHDAHYHWTEELAWVGGPAVQEPLPEIIPLVARSGHWMSNGMAVAALEKVGRRFEFTYRAPTMHGALSAVSAGFGIMPFARRRITTRDFVVLEDRSLPKLSDTVCSICVREAAADEKLDDLARIIAEIVRPPSDLAYNGKLPGLVQAQG